MKMIRVAIDQSCAGNWGSNSFGWVRKIYEEEERRQWLSDSANGVEVGPFGDEFIECLDDDVEVGDRININARRRIGPPKSKKDS